jgi:hypothetical protein
MPCSSSSGRKITPSSKNHSGTASSPGADLHIGQFFDRVVIEQEHPAIPSDSVISRIQVLVENIGGGVIADAMPETDHHGANRVLLGGLQKHRQRHDFQLHDQQA